MITESPLVSATPAAPSRVKLLARLGRRLLLKKLAGLEDGELRVRDAQGEYVFGQRNENSDLSCTLYIDHAQAYADVAFGGTVGAGEAYIRGLWRCDDLTTLVRIFVANRERLNGIDSGWALLSRPLLTLFHWIHRNSRDGSARNIAAHYDLGNELYELMLDHTMAYSCAIFPHPEASLAAGSTAKFDAACRKLQLVSEDHVLEIGSGWGGFAIHAAQRYGCRVTTTTISRAQYEYAQRRIYALGLDDRITLLLQDYRELTGSYDKLVSIEMVEAVGADHLDEYFGHCSRLVKPGGAMLLQAITIQDQFYRRALKSVDFIQRYVFPGSFIPSIEALAGAVARATDFKIFHLEDIGPHYARTLRLWRDGFLRNLGKIRALGYGESFVRLWEYYLCYCEGGFIERQLGTVQVLLTKPRCRRAPLAGSGT